MARSFLVSDLVTAAKQLGDFENSSTLADSEWLTWVSASYARYHNKLVQTGMGYLEATQTITGTGVSTYTLPTDHHASVRVDYQSDTNTWSPLEHISILAKHKYESGQTTQAVAWRIAGANLEILPAPSSGTYRHIYIPGVAKLALGDTVKFDRGFEELVIIEAVLRAKVKEETDTSSLRQERDHLLKELDEALATMTWGESPGISDVDDRTYNTGDWIPSRRWIG